jgi:hypothetical protein
MRENYMPDVINRVRAVFDDKRYRNRVDLSDKRWLDDDINTVFKTILTFLEGL